MRVRITSFGRSDESFLNTLVPKYAFGKKEWKNMQFVSDDSYDWLIILTSPNRATIEQGYNYRKAITFLTESPESSKRIVYPASLVCPMYLPQPYWPVDILERSVSNKKNELLSTVMSRLNGLAGHQQRLRFLSVLDKVVEEGLDIWGRSFGNPIFEDFRNYKGPIEEKYNALWPYKYHFACENTFHIGYSTEKIINPIIYNCVCFYNGCKNMEEFIDERVFIRIDVNDIQQSIEKIAKTIEDEEWDKRKYFLQQQKERVLYHLNPLNIIWMTLEGMDTH